MSEYRPYKITVRLSGCLSNFDEVKEDGIYTFNPCGNRRTTEKSAIKAVKDIARQTSCKVEEIISVEKVM